MISYRPIVCCVFIGYYLLNTFLQFFELGAVNVYFFKIWAHALAK